MRWIALAAIAMLSLSCAKKERRGEPERRSVTASSALASGGVCGPESEPAETACGEAKGHDCNASCGCEQPGSKTIGPILPVSEAKPGDRTRCLVTNTVFQVKAYSPSVEHSGKTYYFCCDGCAEKFREAPAKFIGS